MLRAAVLRLSGGALRFARNGFDEAIREASSEFDWLHVVDEDARESGAPQNVALLSRIVGLSSAPIQYEGGLGLFHLAELVLGLGVSRVVLDEALTKTERSAEYFFSRLGEQVIAVVRPEGHEAARRYAEQGARRLLLDGADEMEDVERFVKESGLPTWVRGEVTHSRRNLEALAAVRCEGALIEGAASENGET